MSWTHYNQENYMFWLKGRFDETGVPGTCMEADRAQRTGIFSDIYDMTDDSQQRPFWNMKMYWENYNATLKVYDINELFTYTAITGLPDVDANGFLNKDEYFRISSLRNLKYYDASDDDELKLNSFDDSAGRWTEAIFEPAGSWNSFESFWASGYLNTWWCGYRSWGSTRASVNAARFENSADDIDDGDDEIVEVLRKRYLSPCNLKWDAASIFPAERTANPTPYDYLYQDITDKQLKKHNYPWMMMEDDSRAADLETRDFRTQHFKVNPGTTWTGLYADIYSRWKTVSAVDTVSEAYVDSKVEYFINLLKVTISTPKEFRVRTQASPLFDRNKLSTLASPEGTGTPAAGTGTPAATTPMGGTSY
jgi:hypothetical protein